VTFGPLTPDLADGGGRYDLVVGPITVSTATGAEYTLDDRNGIEPGAVAHLRTDLRRLLTDGGTVYFGDHDFGQLVELTRPPSGDVRLVANLPSLDVWELDIGVLTARAAQEVLDQIDEVEARFGPLVGHCGACGVPVSGYHESPA
jgi:hypothetical protein